MESGIPKDYVGIASIFFAIKNSQVPFAVELFEPKTPTAAKLKLEGISSEAEAKIFVGTEVFVSEDFVPATEKLKDELMLLNGFLVRDKALGEIGVVKEIIEVPGNPLVKIVRAGKEILFPLHRDFILKIDHKKKVIQVSLPDGMIDL